MEESMASGAMSSDAVKQVRRAANRSLVARADFEIAIRAASQSGASTRAIATAAGLSHQRIWQILRGE
jgi:hypothetical protein